MAVAFDILIGGKNTFYFFLNNKLRTVLMYWNVRSAQGGLAVKIPHVVCVLNFSCFESFILSPI